MTKLKFFSRLLITIILTLGISLAVQSLIAANWVAPTFDPPQNDLYEFINAGPNTQGKLGSLGIGIASPNKRLHVYQDSGDNAEIDIQSTSGANTHWGIYHDGMGGTNDLRFWNNSVPGDKNALTIKTNGNVGIGVTTPNNLLQVANLINFDNTKYGTFLGYQAGNVDTATYNSFIGYQTGYSNTTGGFNSAMGANALYSNTNGSFNSAMGVNALYYNLSSNNSAMGADALYSNTAGYSNSAMGVGALHNNTTGDFNSAMGDSALYANTASNNSAMGYTALYNNTTGDFNSAMGVKALYNNTTGTNNSAMGMYALYNNTTGSNNSAMGVGAGHYITDGNPNMTSNNSLYLGYDTRALANGDTNETVIGASAIGAGSNSVVLGNDSITKTILKGNVGIGTTNPGYPLDIRNPNNSGTAELRLNNDNVTRRWAGTALARQGSEKWFLGMNATDDNLRFRRNSATDDMVIDGSGKIGIGITTPPSLLTVGSGGQFQVNSSGNLVRVNNISYSWPAAQGAADTFLRNDGSGNLTWVASGGGGGGGWTDDGTVVRLTTITDNVGIGTTTPNNLLSVYQLIDFNNTDFNTKLGYQAGLNIVAGAQYNTFVGYQAGLSSASLSTNAADYNSVFGYRALYSNRGGSNNTAMGREALFSNTAGGNNTAMGARALYTDTEGSNNTAMGQDALFYNTTGYENTAMGVVALSSNITGYQNTAMGRQALYSNTTGSNNTAMGRDAFIYNTTGSNNTAMGVEAGRYQAAGTFLTAANNSVYIGYGVRGYNNSDSNSIVIGASAIGIGANTVVLGNNSIITTALKGNVGIGTTNPGYPLDIRNPNNSGTAELRLNNDNVTRRWAGTALARQGSEKWFLGMNATDDNLRFRRNSATDDMVIDGSGKVGIGTTTPQAALDINGSLYLKSDGANSGELKVKYSSSTPAGYYATYAP